MTIRSIDPTMSPAVVARIDMLLDRVAAENGVFLPLAIESGSRAWGFPSPDSDYDCRFVFVRPIAQHLTPWTPRDVIEFPPEGDLDVNGWDLGKALRLMLAGNAVIIEWLSSPIVYRGESWFRDALLDLARSSATRNAIGRHYLHLGRRQRDLHFRDERSVPLKKIFYALRPAAALRWLRQRPGTSVAPMHFPTLMAECDPPSDLRHTVEDLLERKAVTRELGTATLPPSIASFIDGEFREAETAFPSSKRALAAESIEAAERLYRTATERLDTAWRYPAA